MTTVEREPDGDPLSDASIPLCFDTSAVFGVRESEVLMERLREVFPHRALIFPAWVIAERSRQLAADLEAKGRAFDPLFIDQFLDRYRIQTPELDRTTALGAWITIAQQLPNAVWRPFWDQQPVQPARRPCGERCRFGDYAVFAVAQANQAILVTEDRALITQVENLQYRPGIVRAGYLKSVLRLNG